jgi:hypothetical protein
VTLTLVSLVALASWIWRLAKLRMLPETLCKVWFMKAVLSASRRPDVPVLVHLPQANTTVPQSAVSHFRSE